MRQGQLAKSSSRLEEEGESRAALIDAEIRLKGMQDKLNKAEADLVEARAVIQALSLTKDEAEAGLKASLGEGDALRGELAEAGVKLAELGDKVSEAVAAGEGMRGEVERALEERDAAVRERDAALGEASSARGERDAAVRERDAALARGSQPDHVELVKSLEEREAAVGRREALMKAGEGRGGEGEDGEAGVRGLRVKGLVRENSNLAAQVSQLSSEVISLTEALELVTQRAQEDKAHHQEAQRRTERCIPTAPPRVLRHLAPP